MTLPAPLLLALLGIALLGVAIFAPRRPAVPPTVSLAPSSVVGSLAPAEAHAPPGWVASIDPCATGCEASARVALVDALATVASPWARAVLLRAHAEERDAMVRAALYAALSDELTVTPEV